MSLGIAYARLAVEEAEDLVQYLEDKLCNAQIELQLAQEHLEEMERADK